MRFGHFEIFTQDPLKAKEFYENILGFSVTQIQNDEFIWLEFGVLEILLRPNRKAARPETYQDAASAIVLYTDDLARKKRELQERGLEFKGTDGSPSCLTFTDPDGNWFQLVNPNEH